MKNKLVLLHIVLLCTALAAYARTPIQQAYYSGNDTGLFSELAAYILSHPTEGRSLLYFRDICTMDYMKPVSWYKSFGNRYLSLLDQHDTASSRNLRLQAAYIFEEFCYTHRLTDIYPSVTAGYYLQQWKIHDPFIRYGEYDFYHPDILNASQTETCRYTSSCSPDGRIHLDSYMYNDTGVVRASTSLQTPAPVQIRIRSNAEYAVYLDGERCLENSYQKIKRDLRVLQTQQEGTIRLTILLKNRKNGYFSVKTADASHTPVSCRYSPGKEYDDHIDAAEVSDYPLSEPADQRAESLYYRAWLLSTYNSRESFKLYKHSLEKQYSPVVDLQYAQDLITTPNNAAWSESEGWKRIDMLRKTYPDCIPVRYFSARKMIKAGQYSEARKELTPFRTAQSYSGDLLALSLHNETDRSADFHASYKQISRKYPHGFSHYPLAARFWKQQDHSRYIETLQKYLSQKRSETYARDLMNAYSTIGEMDKAYSTASEYLQNNRFRFLYDYTLAQIRNGRSLDSTRISLSNSAQTQNPFIQYLLGLQQLSQGDPPDKYWNVLPGGQIHSYFPQDYTGYTNGPPYSITGIDPENGTLQQYIEDFQNGETMSSHIPIKKHVYRLYENGRAHFGCNQLIHIRNSRDVRSFGEFRIPYDNPRIIRIRTYYRDGTFTDSLQQQHVQGSTYVTLHGLTKDSLIHIAYESLVSSSLSDTSFFITDPVFIVDYDQSLSTFEVKLSAPKSQNTGIRTNRDTPVKKSVHNNRIHTAMKIDDVSEIQQEQGNGSKERTLPFYQIAPENRENTFLKWLYGSSTLTKVEMHKNRSDLSVIADIYRKIQSEIRTASFTSFIPQETDDTLYFQSGSEADKVALCAQMLSDQGIHSYPAIVRNPYKNATRHDTFGSFYGMVLYVPLEERDLFLDFSSRYIKTGMVSHEYAGATGILLNTPSYHQVQIHSQSQSSEQLEFTIDCPENSYTGSIQYGGYAASVRSLFQDSRYTQEYLSRLYQSFRKNIIYSDSSFLGLQDTDKPFTIQSSGTIPSYSSNIKDSVVLQPFLRRSSISSYSTEKKRTQPLFISEPIHTDDSYTITLPTDYSWIPLDSAKTFVYKDARASFTIKKIPGSNTITAVQEVDVPAMRIHTDDYPEFQDFVRNIQKWEEHTIYLQRDPL